MSDVTVRLNIPLLAEKIRDARKSIRLSQHDLADKIGISDKAISAYEVGRAVPPLDILKQISGITGRHISFFFNDSERQDSLVKKVDRMIEELHDLKKTLE